MSVLNNWVEKYATLEKIKIGSFLCCAYSICYLATSEEIKHIHEYSPAYYIYYTLV